MKKPELTEVGWLGPKDEMDLASHRFGKCSECHEIICVEKAVTDSLDTQTVSRGMELLMIGLRVDRSVTEPDF